MVRRYVAIWFRHLITDRIVRRHPELVQVPFVVATAERGRMIVKAANMVAQSKGVHINMTIADCRAICPSLEVFDEKAGVAEKLLNALAEWCLRYTPVVAIDLPDGLILDVSGCAHLWGGERLYLKDIITKLKGYGYDVRVAIADTVGAAWGVSRFGQVSGVVESCMQVEALLPLPAAALRLESDILERLQKLGLNTIRSFMNIPRKALRRRFGQSILSRLDQALGQEYETVTPVQPIEPYQERLPSLEPIITATGIEIALKRLLEKLCLRLAAEEKGLRKCVFKAYRIDGNIQQIEIGTNSPSRNVAHLFKLFEIKIPSIEPALGIDVFTIEASIVEEITAEQDALWHIEGSGNDVAIAELLDRIAGKVGMNTIHRYLPDEHYWPERSFKQASSLTEKAETNWRTGVPRPIHLLPQPETIDVSVAMPDYPPMLFKHKGVLHNISKADGPERIEQEWWLQQGLYRDYYCVEDENGARYWLFRLGSYDSGEPKWFIHGFFA